MEELDIFVKDNTTRGNEYLKKVDFEIPIRIQNILKSEYFLPKNNFMKD